MEAIDVFQRYQGPINWAQVFGAGVRIAFVKLTNGTAQASPAGDGYITGARRVKILVGGYAYALGSHTPESQAIAFAAELSRLDALDVAPALDFEDNSLPTTGAARVAWCIAFFRQLKKSLPRLTKALLYNSGSELASMNVGAVNNGVSGLLIMEWDAEYGPNDGKEHPIVHYKGVAAIHQYTSVGHVAGVTGSVDRDDVIGTITAPLASTSAPQPQETDVQFSDKIPENPTPGTVGFLYREYISGYGGVNTAGAMALNIANLVHSVTGLTAALQAVSALVSAQQGLSPIDVYNHVTKALQESQVQVGAPAGTNPSTPAGNTTTDLAGNSPATS